MAILDCNLIFDYRVNMRFSLLFLCLVTVTILNSFHAVVADSEEATAVSTISPNEGSGSSSSEESDSDSDDSDSSSSSSEEGDASDEQNDVVIRQNRLDKLLDALAKLQQTIQSIRDDIRVELQTVKYLSIRIILQQYDNVLVNINNLLGLLNKRIGDVHQSILQNIQSQREQDLQSLLDWSSQQLLKILQIIGTEDSEEVEEIKRILDEYIKATLIGYEANAKALELGLTILETRVQNLIVKYQQSLDALREQLAPCVNSNRNKLVDYNCRLSLINQLNNINKAPSEISVLLAVQVTNVKPSRYDVEQIIVSLAVNIKQ